MHVSPISYVQPFSKIDNPGDVRAEVENFLLPPSVLGGRICFSRDTTVNDVLRPGYGFKADAKSPMDPHEV